MRLPKGNRDEASLRSESFRGRRHDRYWWHNLADTDYVPSIYEALSDAEWGILDAWFRETEDEELVGEINVPAMCLVQGLVSGGGIRRIVQLGHYAGYSSLLIGFILRRMNARKGLFSIDIDAGVTAFTQKWIVRAGLADYVTLHVGDSADPASIQAARAALGAQPQLVLIDSSHQYGHTIRELDGWAPEIPAGALILLHDTSTFAERWDTTAQGGVGRALAEWTPGHTEMGAINLNAFVAPGTDANALVYRDACGLAIMQRASRP
jgi:predicted O-methyltransferase YrrM